MIVPRSTSSQSHGAIKQESANDLRNIGLKLYKVSIPRKSTAQTLNTLRSDGRDNRVEELDFMDWLVEVFPSGIEKEHLYVFSMKPGTPFDVVISLTHILLGPDTHDLSDREHLQHDPDAYLLQTRFQWFNDHFKRSPIVVPSVPITIYHPI